MSWSVILAEHPVKQREEKKKVVVEQTSLHKWLKKKGD